MLIILGLQLMVPVLLLLWLAVLPPSSLAGFALHTAAAGAWLLAIALTGVWTALPWWTPHALAVALAVIVTWRLGAARRPLMPARTTARWGTAAWLLVVVACLLQSVAAIGGRTAPAGPIASIRSPLAQGRFLVVNGGSHVSVNAHLKTLSPTVPRFRAWRGQSLGIDVIRIGPLGLRSKGLRPADPSAYAGFGSRVLAPCDGTIVRTVDGLPDNRVPVTDREQMAGNHVIVRCKGFDVVLAHLRRGSVAVRPADQVTAGQAIGELGNSGNSDEPHLHLHAQRTTPPHAPFSSEPVALRVDGRFLVRNDQLRGEAPGDRRQREEETGGE